VTSPEVTICIPAYQAEGFIDRTLRFAAGQTLRELRILVSIDASTDRTEKVCRAFAATDPRVEVITGPERLGWGGNVNRLLDAVTTEFFFIYFHDDIILPQYAGTLLAALRADPDAASANASVQTFGNSDEIEPAHAFRGSLHERLSQLWLPDFFGMPLRSMIRRDRLGPAARLPEGIGGMLREEAFLAQLVAAGPAVAVETPLYLRWVRDAGVLGSWRALPFEDFLAGWRTAIGQVDAFLDAAPFGSEPERGIARHVFLLRAWDKILAQHRLDARRPIVPRPLAPLLRRLRPAANLPPLTALDPASGAFKLPDDLDRLPADLRARVERFHAAVVERHARQSHRLR
jgi:glycosyltransferase involved in cell wall biosynthesis